MGACYSGYGPLQRKVGKILHTVASIFMSPSTRTMWNKLREEIYRASRVCLVYESYIPHTFYTDIVAGLGTRPVDKYVDRLDI